MSSRDNDSVNLEEEYFHKESQAQIEALRARMGAEKAEKEKADQKALHAGHCGRCGSKMHPQPFKGVEIDVCPSCGAVLLDPGELETLAGDDKGFFGGLSGLFKSRK
jgi:Transcription factor zinc-finger